MSFDPVSAALDLGGKIIERIWPDPKMQAEAKLKLLEMQQNGELAEMTAAKDIIVAEAKSEHTITSTWRPIMMLSFVAIVVNNYILAPYLNLFFDVNVVLELPPDMWDLLKIGLGGYVMGRSGEKIVRDWKKEK